MFPFNFRDTVKINILPSVQINNKLLRYGFRYGSFKIIPYFYFTEKVNNYTNFIIWNNIYIFCSK